MRIDPDFPAALLPLRAQFLACSSSFSCAARWEREDVSTFGRDFYFPSRAANALLFSPPDKLSNSCHQIYTQSNIFLIPCSVNRDDFFSFSFCLLLSSLILGCKQFFETTAKPWQVPVVPPRPTHIPPLRFGKMASGNLSSMPAPSLTCC